MQYTHLSKRSRVYTDKATMIDPTRLMQAGDKLWLLGLAASLKERGVIDPKYPPVRRLYAPVNV